VTNFWRTVDFVSLAELAASRTLIH